MDNKVKSVINQNPIISVVIPIYNAESYIAECIKSVINQETSVPFEIICINDGSTDNSLEICKTIAKDYPNIKVINQDNGGVTAARRKGVEESEGEWIYFVDADDILPLDSLRNMYESIDGDKYDIIVGEVSRQTKEYIIPIDKYRIELIRGGNIGLGPVGKFYRKCLFKDSVMDIPREIVHGEDKMMNLRLSFQTTKPVFFNGKRVYEYNNVSSSASHTFKRTPEFEEMYNEHLLLSIPDEERDRKEYIHAVIANRINAWNGLNFMKLSTKPMRNTAFYTNLTDDIKNYEYTFKFKEWIYVKGKTIPVRMLAIILQLWPILMYKIKRTL